MARSKAFRRAKDETVKAAMSFISDTVPGCAALLALAEATAQLIAENCPIARIQELSQLVRAIEKARLKEQRQSNRMVKVVKKPVKKRTLRDR